MRDDVTTATTAHGLHHATKTQIISNTTSKRGRGNGAGERHSCPLRPRRLVRTFGHEQGMAAPSVACAPTQKQNSARPLKRPKSCTPLALCSRDRSRQSPPQQTPWTGQWQRHQTTKTTRTPLEPELIDMPPAPASAPPMSSLERCIALRLVYCAGPR